MFTMLELAAYQICIFQR